MGKRQLYYEIIEDEKTEIGETDENAVEKSTELELGPQAIEPERDGYAELMNMAKSIERVKFRVKPDYSGKRTAVAIALGASVMLGALLIGLLKNTVAVIAVSAVLLAVIVGAIIAMCVLTSAQNKGHYCMYVRDGSDVTCLSVVGSRCVLFTGGAAYRTDGEEFCVLDADGFIEYLEGECSGLVAVLSAKREDVSFDDNVYTVTRGDGKHTVYAEDGKIAAIASEQPVDVGVDRATGMSVKKTEKFVKLEPVYDFEFAIPEFMKSELEKRGIRI